MRIVPVALVRFRVVWAGERSFATGKSSGVNEGVVTEGSGGGSEVAIELVAAGRLSILVSPRGEATREDVRVPTRRKQRTRSAHVPMAAAMNTDANTVGRAERIRAFGEKYESFGVGVKRSIAVGATDG